MRKALILFGNEIERDSLIETAIYLKRKLGFALETLYVRDVEKERPLSTPDGMVMAGRMPLMLKDWNDVERVEIEAIESQFVKSGLKEKLIFDMGTILEVATRHMKKCDMLVVGKNEVMSDSTLSLIKYNYKTILLVGNTPFNSLDNIIFGNDNGVKIDKSIFSFIHLFNEVINFNSITINKDDKDFGNDIIEYLEQNNKKVTKIVCSNDDYMENINKSNLFIMGNLSRSYFIERIVGKNGIKLLENTKAPIFIG